MTDSIGVNLPSGAMLRRAALIVGVIGVIWGAVETAIVLEILDPDSALATFSGRTGWGIGLGTVATWLAAVVAVAVVFRYPALSTTLLFLASGAGFLLAGKAWIGPGVVLAIASWIALLGVDSPFAAEIAKERRERAAAQTPAN